MHLFSLLLMVWTQAAQVGREPSSPFDPEHWSGPVKKEVRRAAEPHIEAVVTAMRAGDPSGLEAAIRSLEKTLGPFSGSPETRPVYLAPIDDRMPDFARVSAVWKRSAERAVGRHGWQTASPRQGKRQRGDRLRVSVRSARAYLHSYEAGLEGGEHYLEQAIEASDYLLGAQSRRYGVFGYPYDPAGPGLQQYAARVVQLAVDAGRPIEEIVEHGWVVNVFGLGDGGLQFDNGMCGIHLLYTYSITGDRRYLEAAERAGDWAARQPLVRNFNYNSFSAYLLARLYRATGRSQYLAAARVKMRFGVMAGQLESGRWVDPHNARIQYHSVMLRAMIEYYLALEQAGDDEAGEVARRIELGLDNLAEQVTRFGASNAHEALSLDALSLGMLVLGTHDSWQRAANVLVNAIYELMLPQLEARGLPMTESIASYLLYRRVAAGEAEAREVLPRLGLPF